MASDPLDSLVGVELSGVLSLPFVGGFRVFEQVLCKSLNQSIFISKSYMCLCRKVEVCVGEFSGVVVSHLTGERLKWFLFQKKHLRQLAKKGLEASVGGQVGCIAKSQVPFSHLVQDKKRF